MSGTSPMKMQTAIVLFFMSEFTAVWVAIYGGSVLDILENEFLNMGWFDTVAAWGGMSGYRMIADLFFLCPYAIGLLGLFILLFTIYQRYFKDTGDDDYEYGINGGNL